MSRPPYRALQTLVALAEHGTVQRAAAALAVTPGAIFQQLQGLTEYVGMPLTDRRDGRTVLTPAAADFAAAVRPHFAAIEAETARRFPRVAPRSVRITADPLLASTWLSSRLRAFRRAEPGLDVQLIATVRRLDLTVGEADLAIRLGIDRADSCMATTVGTVRIVAVHAPSLAADPASLPLIGYDFAEGLWDDWFGRTGYAAAVGRAARHVVDDGLAAINLAMAGEGAALTILDAVAEAIDDGRLLALPVQAVTEVPVRLLEPPSMPLRPAAAVLKTFLTTTDDVD